MKDNDLSGCIGILTMAGVAIVVGIIANGWALSVLWGWFITPIFDLPLLTIGQAIGVSCVTSFLFPKQSKQGDDKKRDGWEYAVEIIGIVLIAPLFAVAMGWVVLQFVK